MGSTYALLHEDVELALIFDIEELLAAIGRVGDVQLQRERIVSAIRTGTGSSDSPARWISHRAASGRWRVLEVIQLRNSVRHTFILPVCGVVQVYLTWQGVKLAIWMGRWEWRFVKFGRNGESVCHYLLRAGLRAESGGRAASNQSMGSRESGGRISRTWF